MRSWQVAFTGTWPAWVVLGLGAAALALTWAFYRRKRGSVRPGVLRALTVLRAAAVVIVTLFLLKPVIRYSRTTKEQKTVAVLMDVSESMSIRDATEGRSRLEAGLHLLRGERHGLLRRLAEGQPVRLFSFGAFTAEQDPRAPLRAEHKLTAIGDALRDVVTRVGEASLCGVVLLSDGVNTAGEEPHLVARGLGVPVYTVVLGGMVGKRGRFLDVGIASAPHNLEFIVNNEATLRVRVSNHGLSRFAPAERKLKLTLSGQGRELASTSVQLPAEDGVREVEVRYTPTETGIYKLTLSLPVLPGEVVKENNERSFTVRVTNPRIRTLLVEGVVRAEYRFLRRVLESDPNVELTSVVKLRRDRFYLQGVDPGIDLSRGLPSRKQDYAKFDVVVLGDIAADEFTAGQLQQLKDFVADGGGLLTMGGRNAYGSGGWAASPLAEALPVRMRGPADGQTEQPFVPRLTPAGRVHPVFAGCAELFEEGTRRAELDGANRVAGAKPGATVLAVHPGEMAGAEPMPVVAVQRFGAGRVLSLMADTTWKWKFQVEAKGLESPYYRFWRQSLRWLAGRKEQEPRGEALLKAWPSKLEYGADETVIIEARARGRDREPTDNAEVRALIHYPTPPPPSPSSTSP